MQHALTYFLSIIGGATLIFEVELFDFEGEDISKDRDKSIIKRIKSSGEGYDHPNVSSKNIFSQAMYSIFHSLDLGGWHCYH